MGSADAPMKSMVAPKSVSENKARKGSSQKSPVMGGMKSPPVSPVEAMLRESLLKSPIQRQFPPPESDSGAASPMLLHKDVTFRNLHQGAQHESPMTAQKDDPPADGGHNLATPPAVDLTSPRAAPRGGGVRDDLIGGTDLASPRGGTDGQ